MILVWDELTQASYGSGLLPFRVFCDKEVMREESQAPTSHALLSDFVKSLAGAYSGNTINNYLAGVQVWHILNGLP
ncbi:hypothetical protein P691DRAFT_680538 [Macrolepiota fuliginosa MF-IS2]|uniref:Uncharacterized protein n=1 Tax=Macrolepiota fuliginosa MF-IS2 TaxID=1400762 RepID=A0A9P6BYY8_9AGAR|nr:hypothetical protein P691DRAFT_680538 [Macrolepiota fuliginosa MF-IS2]